MQIYPEKRTQDIETFREQLNASPTVQAAAAQEEEVKKEPKYTKKEEVVDPIEEEEYYRGYPGYDDKPKKNASKIAIVILVILIIAAVGAGVYVAKNGGFGNKEENTSQSADRKLNYSLLINLFARFNTLFKYYSFFDVG